MGEDNRTRVFVGNGGLFNPVKPYRVNPVKPCRGFTGEFILEWLRKPEYWGGSYTGLWRLYTPELPTPSELAAARALCDNVCSKQPVIKGTLPRRDIAHMAATALGCLTWGIEERHGDYGLGEQRICSKRDPSYCLFLSRTFQC